MVDFLGKQNVPAEITMTVEPRREDLPPVHASVLSNDARILRAAGLIVVGCIIAAGVFSPDPPSHGGTDAAVLAFYQQHLSGILTGSFLWDLAMLALVLFAVMLGRACAGLYAAAHAGAATRQPILWIDLLRPLSTVAAMLFIVSQAAESAAAFVATHGAPAFSIRSLDEMSHMTGHLGMLPLGSWILSAGLAQRASRCGGQWIAWIGIVSGGAVMATTSWVAFGQQWLHNAGVFALLGFLFWTAASSVSLLLNKRLS